VLFDQVTLLQGLEKLPHIVLGKVPANAELSADLIDNPRLGGSALEKFEDSRPNKVEVEHLTLPDIQHYCAVFVVRAAHCVGNSVHRKTHLLALAVGMSGVHSDTLGQLKPAKVEDFR
jgi:hypothetical protein